MFYLTTRITERYKGWFLVETLPGRADSIAFRRSFDFATGYEESHQGSTNRSASGIRRAGHYFWGYYGREPGKLSKKPFEVLWDRDIDTPTGPTDTVLKWVRDKIAKGSGHASAYPLCVPQDMQWFALHTVVVSVGVSADGYRFMLLEHVI